MKVGTWNLENLFRPGGESGPTGESEYEAKLDTLAQTITELEPDVLAVQEVGDPEALGDLVAKLNGDWRSELAEPDGRGIRVGFISRPALSKVTQYSEFIEGLEEIQVDDEGGTLREMGRPALRARVRSGGTSVDVISTHLKSKLLSFPGGRFTPRDEGERARFAVYALHRRAAEAATVRAAVDAVLDEKDGAGEEIALVLAGDLNDEPQAATTQILLGPGGSEFGTTGYERSDKGDARRLWNLAPLIPEEERWTRVYRGRGELIDHLMVSHALTEKIESVTAGPTDPASITDNPNRRRDVPGSDHRPVVATLTV